MLGMFAKPDLSLPERAALMLTIVHASLMAYIKHHEWLTEDLRATLIQNWLKQNERKAGVWFRSRISAAADSLARFLVSTQDAEDIEYLYELLNEAQRIGFGKNPDVDVQFYKIMAECERALIAKGLAA